MNEIFSNEFGTIRPNRVTYYRKKGFLSGGSEEDIPLRHVTSVRYEVTRPWIWGTILVLAGLPVAFEIGGFYFLLGGLMVLVGVILILGFPTVSIGTSSGDKERMLGKPWKKSGPQDFVRALKEELFKEENLDHQSNQKNSDAQIEKSSIHLKSGREMKETMKTEGKKAAKGMLNPFNWV